MGKTIRFYFHRALKKENDSPFTFLVCFACRTWSSYINNIFPPQFLWSWHCILFHKISLIMLVKNKYLLRVHSCIFLAPHSSTLAWRIPWMEEPGGLQSIGSLRVGHDWCDLAAAACIFYQYSSEDTTYYIPLMLLSSFNWSILRSFYSSFFFLEKVKGILAFSMYQIISHTGVQESILPYYILFQKNFQKVLL